MGHLQNTKIKITGINLYIIKQNKSFKNSHRQRNWEMFFYYFPSNHFMHTLNIYNHIFTLNSEAEYPRKLFKFLWDRNLHQFFTNLFLCYYESRWIRQLRKSDIRYAKGFANIFRFIDDLTAINERGRI